MDESEEDPRLPHHRNPKEFVSSDHLAGQTSFSLRLSLFIYLYIYLLLMGMGDYADLGVLYWHLNPENYENDEELQRIREARGYNYMVLRTYSCHIFLFFFLFLIDLASII
jgi:1,2-dihydroxy-3-keto-5-methylthiopentene dioxygenase